MKIQSSEVMLNAASSDYQKTTYKKTSLNIIGNINQEQGEKSVKQQFKDQLRQLRNEAKETNKTENTEGVEIKLSEKDYQKIQLLERILSALTGRNVKFQLPKNLTVNGDKYDQHVHNTVNKLPNQQFSLSATSESFTYERASSMAFNAGGSVTTADGKTIDFNLNMSTSRYIKLENHRTSVTGQLIDPLALNFDGSLPALTDKKYDFDLDNDGNMDQISFLTKGSGFLALDKNNDGTINDGSELFGTTSGSGFKDLAEYDKDNNGWIDENDEIFEGLRIWMKDEEGNDQLVALGEKGVGAIYLGAAATQFDLLGSNFERNGQIKESGIYLNENGTAGTIHHVDIQL